MTRNKQRRSRPERLAEQVSHALELKALFENEVVQRYFDIERKRILLQLYETATHDTEQCRHHALELKCLDTFVMKLSGVIKSGETAAKELAQMDVE